MTPGFYLSPLNVAHYLDTTGVALCGRYAPAEADARPAPADATRCRWCGRIARPDADAPVHVKTPKATTLRNEAIRQMRAENPSATNVELANAFGVTVTEVRRAIRGTQAGRKPLPAVKIEALRAARAAGHKVEQIAAEHQVSMSTVTLYTRKAPKVTQ